MVRENEYIDTSMSINRMCRAVDYRTSSLYIHRRVQKKNFSSEVVGSASKTMAAAGTAAKEGMWIVRMWRKGWEKIPVIMASHCLTAPFLLHFIGERIIYGRPEIPVEKYRNKYTVVRPGDPRIARINNHSRIDNMGIYP